MENQFYTDDKRAIERNGYISSSWIKQKSKKENEFYRDDKGNSKQMHTFWTQVK